MIENKTIILILISVFFSGRVCVFFKVAQIVDLFQQLYNNNSDSDDNIRGLYCRSYLEMKKLKWKTVLVKTLRKKLQNFIPKQSLCCWVSIFTYVFWFVTYLRQIKCNLVCVNFNVRISKKRLFKVPECYSFTWN